MGKQGSKEYDPSNAGRRMSGGDYSLNSKMVWLHGLKSHDFHVLRSHSMKYSTCKGSYVGRKHLWLRKDVKSIVFVFVLMSFLILLDSFLVSFFDSMILQNSSTSRKSPGLKEDESNAYIMKETSPVQMYDRLQKLASASIAKKESEQESSSLWEEPNRRQVAAWKPSADRKVSKSLGKYKNSNGYILVSANGGLNQQRVAICNAVAVASLLNATLVIPRFLYSNVWNDPSQFGDIYQEEYFIDVMKDEVNIVKELPSHLASLDLEAIGSLITDADLVKEAKPTDYMKTVLPVLLKNGVVHFLGYGNRLGFDPLPSELQRLRCKCNFHALKFAPDIQRVGSLLVKTIRKYDAAMSLLDNQLLGDFMHSIHSKQQDVAARGPFKYLALHLRFEIDMVAYSLCDFGGGESERNELQAYREVHFPLLIERLKNSKSVSQSELRKLGKCPLTPEEAALVLAGVGFKHRTYIYLAGSQIYGGNSRMNSFTDLYPNLVTKETLLTPSELAPFQNFSSKLAALDFIACATADVFAMTDSGSQLSSLVSGFRTYYGGGNAPTLRPNKKRLAAILSENSTIGWNSFEDRVKKMIEEGQRVHVRRFGRSIYRQPRCPQCMCKSYL
ncbi:O-fucosyltransferase 8 [Argentina anserina]|uniref:O-fucosyltransferase 8 n=1 Tax=Argentina anserina TaxID=57926 RepID=UPI00217651B2|nr:O-fucosyltransferase 8 [Potentilla anserina]